MFHRSVLLSFVFLITFINFPADASKQDILKLVKMVSHKAHKVNHPVSINSFYYRYWLNKWHKAKTSEGGYVLKKQNYDLADLHSTLYSRFEKFDAQGLANIEVGLEPELIYREKAKQKKDLFSDDVVNIQEDKIDKELQSNINNFNAGHFIHLKGKIDFPIIMVALHERNRKTPLKWFHPLEQMLTIESIGDYRNRLATLKFWNSYSHLSFVTIPPESEVNLVMGLAAPKLIPQLNYSPEYVDWSSLYNKVETDNIEFTFKKYNCKPTDIIESLDGGGSQILVGKIKTANDKKVKVFPAYSLFNHSYVVQIAGQWQDPNNANERIHFSDSSYDKHPISVIEILKSHPYNVIDDNEYKELVKFHSNNKKDDF